MKFHPSVYDGSVRRGRSLRLCIALTLVAASCVSGPVEPLSTPGTSSVEVPSSTGTAATDLVLVERDGPRRMTSGSVPHVQLGAEPIAELDAELRRRIFLLPGVADVPSDRSLPGARGFALSSELELARPDVIAGSSEFAHLHPDGSLHVWLPVDRAVEVDALKWGELHPWVGRDGFWDGVVMVFTPETPAEVDVVVALVVEAYNLVVGADLTPADIS